MKLSQIAAQLYTLRNCCKTPADTAATLKKVRAIGYPAVQVSGVCAMPEADLAAMIRDAGLVCCATHESGDSILNQPAQVAARLKALGCRITAYPWPGGIDFNTLESVKAFAARLNASGKVLADAGCVLCYHNHHIEFRRVGGRAVLDILYAETDPRYLQGEPDTYWVQNGGGDPVAWCRKLKGRLPIIHLKDYVVNAKNEVMFTEVGNGNLAWPQILAAADDAGCEWFCVEQDTCPGDPFDSLRQSYEFLRPLAKG
ncbi:MAG: sugar phosphate isomerase/epimerase [Lentisphaerae bacterium]|nr:sugar phosphate isomerase/epimerase [Lentisphaerota bacterium]